MTDASALLSEASRELARFPGVLDLLVGELDEGTCRSRPAPNEWAPVEIICHLRDEETEDFAARVSVILDGGVRFAPNDPERSAIERRYREADLRAALATFHARRAASIELLATVAPNRLFASADRPTGGRLSGLDLLLQPVALGTTRDVDKRRHPVQRREHLVRPRSRLDVPRPADNARRAHAAFPGAQLPGFERGDAAVREGLNLSTVVGGEDDDGVVVQAEVLELLHHQTDVVVELGHAGFLFRPAVLGVAQRFIFWREVRDDVHARRVEPDKERRH